MNRVITKAGVVWANPIKDKQTAFTRKPTINGMRVSNLETSQPDMGNPIMELMGIIRRTEPNSASFKSKAVLMVGILDAKLEKVKPDRKKKVLSAIRCLLINCIMVK